MAGSLIGGIVQVVNLVRDLVNSGYKAEAEWEGSRRRLEFVRARSDSLANLESTYGPDVFGNLKALLEEARKLLEDQKKKFGPKRQGIWNPVRKIIGVPYQAVFPAAIGRAMDKVDKAFDQVVVRLKESTEFSEYAQATMLEGKPPLVFERDGRYVKLETTTAEVKEALCKAENRLAVLYGEAGRGKSSLARDLVLEIKLRGKAERQELIDKLSSTQAAKSVASTSSHPPLRELFDELSSTQAAESVASTSSHPPSCNDGSTQFHRAFHEAAFLTFGPNKIEVEPLLRDLLNQLSWLKVEDVRDSKLSTAVVKLFRHKKLLVVLDDVWNSEVLQEVLMFAAEAPHVKFLVTSQVPDIGNRLNTNYSYERLTIKITLSEATNILARHIFNPNPKHRSRFRAIPDNEGVQKCARDIVEMVDGNAFAIACVGGAARLGSKELNNVKRWEEVKAELYDYLRVSDRVAHVQSVKYSHPNYVAAMAFSVSKLCEEEKMLLILASWCKEPSVDEVIVKYIYERIREQTQFQPFSLSADTLAGRSLVRIEEETWRKSWSVHSLLRHFLSRYEKTSHISVVNKTEKEIVSAICLLYFKDRELAILGANVWHTNLTNSNFVLDIREKRRKELYQWCAEEMLRLPGVERHLSREVMKGQAQFELFLRKLYNAMETRYGNHAYRILILRRQVLERIKASSRILGISEAFIEKEDKNLLQLETR